MKNIALVMGGFSGEHLVSLGGGQQIYQAIDKSKYNVYRIVVGKVLSHNADNMLTIDRQQWYWIDPHGAELPVDRSDFSITVEGKKVHFDLAFIIVHGNPGENGVLQGYFDMLGIPYTTCGFYTSALTFHKGFCNAAVRSFGIVDVAKSVLLYKVPSDINHTPVTALRYPIFVKPAAGGSSVGTTKVKTSDQLIPAIELAFKEDTQVMVEECINGREFDCGVMKIKGKKYVFPITEIIPTEGHEFFDYEAKYNGFSQEVTPADVEEPVAKHIQEVSSRLYDLLQCRGVVRFDYIYDVAQRRLYFLEVNTIPGQSAESIVPKQARAIGITPAQLYQMLIEDALL